MKKILILLIFTFCVNYIFSQNTLQLDSVQQSPKATLNDISWIEGHWRGEAFGGMAEEIWSPPLGNSMMGSFKLVVDNKVNFYEILTISEVEETLILRLKHFSEDLKGWEEKDEAVEFKLVKIEENKVYFNGLTFEKVNENELNIFVVISNENEKQEAMFAYKRFQE
jgi:Domain of unknown function (DUF6265)